MSPRRRRCNADLPPNLYRRISKGIEYYEYRDPTTGKRHSAGKDKAAAIAGALQLNHALSLAKRSYTTRLRLRSGDDWIVKLSCRIRSLVPSRTKSLWHSQSPQASSSRSSLFP